jgi:uncharacterized membrane protein
MPEVEDNYAIIGALVFVIIVLFLLAVAITF